MHGDNILSLQLNLNNIVLNYTDKIENVFKVIIYFYAHISFSYAIFFINIFTVSFFH